MPSDDAPAPAALPTIETQGEEKWPYRLADAWNHGWLGDGKGNYHGYDPAAQWEQKMLDLRPLADVEAAYGPTRPVIQYCPADDLTLLHGAFDLAGRKAIGSLCAALEMVFNEARDRYDPAVHGTGTWAYSPDYAYAVRTMTAGRPGSWEAEALTNCILFGNELNLWPRKGNRPADEMRATGPHPKRVHVEARDQLAEMLRRWTGSPDLYVEVAETLSEVVSAYADDRHGSDGWYHIADQWLQPQSLATDNYERVSNLLYSKTRYRYE